MISNKSFENIEKLKHVRMTVTNQNHVHEELEGKLYLDNATS
jgi:hypothetical protein